MIGSLYGMAVEIVQKSKPKSKPMANVLKLKLSEKRPLPIDDGTILGYQGPGVTNAGQMDSGACFFKYPKRRSTLSRCHPRQLPKTFTDEVAAFRTALSGLIRGWKLLCRRQPS